ncbi:MAG TPA: DUF255 domain-containing protein [Candidatus Obscuribacterales bacterium]
MRAAIWLALLVCFAVLPSSASNTAGSGAGGLRWESWSDGVFERAKREKKFVLLDLEAVWCHWCHVMDEKTYRNPAVIKLIRSKYIPVRVDQDSRPDLSNRYEDYGWPATVVFNSSGGEIVKRAGYIPPDEMTSLLTAIIKDPTPGPSVQPKKSITYARDAFLSAALRKELQGRYVAGYDEEKAGWGTYHKFMDWDSVEYSMARAKGGDERAARMARETLAAQLKLIDPVWGGVYQYSTDGDWDHPHFEKIMQMQAENMRIYSQAYLLWNDPKYLKAATDIHRYLKAFLLSPEGCFYTSQDADLVKGKHSGDYFSLSDAERRKRGMPAVDRHMYARENGWAINALVALYSATGDEQYFDQARRAAEWIIKNRSLPGGGFSHDSKDPAGPYLGDTLAMGRAFLSLYAASGDRQWLSRAEQAADFIGKHFQTAGAGFVTADVAKAGIHKPEPQRDENVMMARFANLLYHYSGKPAYKKLADQAMRYLATADVARQRRILVSGILLADTELTSDPAHVTVVGRKDDPQAKALFAAALKYPAAYKRVEWWDSREGPLPNMDVEFPQLDKAAAFACANKRCSLPVFKPDGVAAMVDRLNRS